MSEKLKAPKITNYISYLGRVGYRNVDCSFSYDEKSYLIIDELFEIIKQIEPVSQNGARELWLRAERGTLEDFGNVDEMIEDGEVENRNELERWWLDEFPDETVWYHFTAVEDEDIGYRMILLGNKFIIEVDPRCEKDYPHDISELAEWLLDSVKECISEIKDGTYNAIVEEGLPPQHRTGTIVRRHLWDAFPEARESFFKDISKADVEDFIALARAQDSELESTNGRLKTVTANDFYSFCALGYKVNNYKDCDLSPKEQYYRHADGRDDGLGEIDADSPEAFSEWYHNRNRHGGHPWEVCRGGNSTHVSLYVVSDKDGFYLSVAGDAWSRTIETVKFYLALRKAELPVFIHEAESLAARLDETEKIGIVPDGVMPAYCQSWFPKEHIIDYMNLPTEKATELLPFCVWQPVTQVQLLAKDSK